MTYKHSSPSNRLKARRLLVSMLPKAREAAKEDNWEQTREASHIFKGMIAHLKEENLDGVHIYPAPKGGWHADITLKNMPVGVPAVIGTPVAMPCNSRQEAVDHASSNLQMLLRLIDDRSVLGEIDTENVPFHFDQVGLLVPRGLLEQLHSHFLEATKTAQEKNDLEQYTFRRLAEVSKKYGGDEGLRSELFESLSMRDRMEVLTVAAMALMFNIPRWPSNEDGPPRGSRSVS